MASNLVLLSYTQVRNALNLSIKSRIKKNLNDTAFYSIREKEKKTFDELLNTIIHFLEGVEKNKYFF